MTTDMTAPATKQDIQLLAQEMKNGFGRMSAFYDEFVDFREETNSRFNRLEERLYSFETHVENSKEEILLHFDASVEITRHELRSANREEILNIKDRVARLERHTRLRTA